MNYRHVFHAGNFADVMKHSLQCLCLTHLQQKTKPFFVLDTHAGVGLYDLLGEQAQKTGEWQHGIARLLATESIPTAIDPYVKAIKSLNPRELRFYPGSPWLAQQFLRDDDHLALAELHPVDALQLAENMDGDTRVKVHIGKDGYQVAKALLPPVQRRGMVLTDPPFEQVDEFQAVITMLEASLKRWSSGTYAIWYPIKDPLKVGEFHRQVKRLQPPKTITTDLLIRAAEDSNRLNGCGMMFINPPYSLQQNLAEVMPFLTQLLAQDKGASWESNWLVEES